MGDIRNKIHQGLEMRESAMTSVIGKAENLNNYYSPANLHLRRDKPHIVSSPSPTIDHILIMVTLISSPNQSHGQTDNLTIKLDYSQPIVCERHHTIRRPKITLFWR